MAKSAEDVCERASGGSFLARERGRRRRGEEKKEEEGEEDEGMCWDMRLEKLSKSLSKIMIAAEGVESKHSTL